MKEIFQYIEEHGKTIVLFLTTLIFLLLIVVLWQFFQREPKDVVPAGDVYEELLAEDPEEINPETASVEAGNEIEEHSESKEIMVDVKGAVQSPGVYTMATNSRIVDAIDQAGGLTETAEQNAVNLAQIVEDQMVIYVPEVGEEGDNLTQAIQENNREEEDQENNININTAEKERLMTLNGIGSSKADSILSYREEHGNFKTIEDIKNVSGIGDATFENLKDMISVD